MRYLFTSSLVIGFALTSILAFAQSESANPFDKKQKTQVSDERPNLESLDFPEYINVHARSCPDPFVPKALPTSALSADQNIQVNYNTRRGNVLQTIFMSTQSKVLDDLLRSESTEDQSIKYFEQVRHQMGLIEETSSFIISRSWTDELNQKHIRFNQELNDIPVYMAEVILHIQDENVQILNGSYVIPRGDESSEASIGKEQSIDIAYLDLIGKNYENLPNSIAPGLIEDSRPKAELIYYVSTAGKLLLSWHVTAYPNQLERYEYFIDALDGSILSKYNHTCSAGPTTATATDLLGNSRTINTYELGGTYYLLDASQSMFNSGQSALPDDPVGAIWTIDAQNTDLDNVFQITSGDNTWSTPTAISAHFNAGLCFDYFNGTHGRNSLDGDGGNIISVVNVTSNGSSMENAYWNGKVMAYGNGGTTFEPLAKGLDVAAHEMTHGVISSTANLEYKNQSGAINESMADIFGVMVDRDDWTLGEDIMKAGANPTGVLRDLQNPNNGGSLGDWYWQPDHMDDFQDLEEWQDNGGVHVNSGIPNRAFYLFATAIGKDEAEDIYYRALTTYLTRSSEFVDLRLAVIEAAKDLHGAGSNQVTQVGAAFDAVGLFDGNGGNHTSELNENEGDEYILSYDVNGGNANTLYISSTTGTNFSAMSQTACKRKPSVTDDGQYALFVDDGDNISVIDLIPGAANERSLSSSGGWDNVSISKDGSKIAAISTAIDTTIWVYDFGLAQWKGFELYNPTFTQGEKSGGPLFADAVDWDNSGEFLMYDAFNSITNSNGDDIEYWDVGFINVWDNANNTWGDGKVTKLFPNLPEDVNVGNPVFSKNSPHIIAYDYFDNFNNVTSVNAANIETGEANVIYSQDLLGNPNFSTHDDFLVFTGLNATNDTIVASIALGGDKISPSGSASAIIDDGKWPVWYAQGFRVGINDLRKQSLTASAISLYPNPSIGQISIIADFASDNRINIKIYNMLGEIQFEKTYTSRGGERFREEINLGHLQKGSYIVHIRGDKESFRPSMVVIQ